MKRSDSAVIRPSGCIVTSLGFAILQKYPSHHETQTGKIPRAFDLLLVGAGVTILAHHGSAGGDDLGKRITLTGVVTRIEWVNPHAFIYLDVKDGKGRTANWAVEGNPPNVLLRSGWTKEMLMPDIEISVIGFTARTFSNLNQALAYSPDAVAHLKSAHILQAGEIRLSGQNRPFGMGPSFSAAP